MEITVHDLARKLAAGEPVILLDVRQPEEHAYAALPASVLVPLPDLPQRWESLDLPECATVVAYCHHGIRSLRAAGFLRHCGVPNVVSLRGGIDAWSLQIDPKLPRY